VKPVAVVLATFLLTGSAFAGQKDKIIGKQVRLPNHGLGTIVGRSEEGFIIMPVDANGVRAHSAANRLARR
jgi:hypothetical protein